MSLTFIPGSSILVNDLSIDRISEKTTNGGVSVDNVLLKNGELRLPKTVAPASVDSNHISLYYDSAESTLKYRKNDNDVETNHDISTFSNVSAGTPGAQTNTSGLTFSSNPIVDAGSIALSTTGVSAGAYTFPLNITVDATGRLTAVTESSANSGILVSSSNVSYFARDWSTITTGYASIIMGTDSGGSITSAVGNVLIGSIVGNGLTTGHLNVALGYHSGDITIGDNNTAIGAWALGDGNKTGNYNTMIGSGSGRYMSSGSFNTMIGNDTGHVLKTGNYNIVLGANSDVLTGDTTNCIVIGNELSAGTGELRIGNNAGDLITARLTTGSQHFSPTTDAVVDLGRVSQQWNNLYAVTTNFATTNVSTLNATTVVSDKFTTNGAVIEPANLDSDLSLTMRSNRNLQLSLNADLDNIDESQRPIIYLSQDGTDTTGASMHLDDNKLKITSGSSVRGTIELSAGCSYATTGGITAVTQPASGPAIQISNTNQVTFNNPTYTNGIAYNNYNVADSPAVAPTYDTEILNYYKTYNVNMVLLPNVGSGKSINATFTLTRIGNVVHYGYPEMRSENTDTNSAAFSHYTTNIPLLESFRPLGRSCSSVIRTYDTGTNYDYGVLTIDSEGMMLFYCDRAGGTWSIDGSHLIYSDGGSFII